MAAPIPEEFLRIFSQLWTLPAGMDFNAVTEAPAFTDLCAYSNTHCYARIEGVFDQAPFARGLQRLGAPCFFEVGSQLANSDINQAAEQFYLALMQQSAKRIYLCPLDCAGEIPCMTFGNAEIKIYSPAELGALLNTATVRRQPDYKYSDTKKLAEFMWLVIESDVEMAPEFQQRYYPYLSIDIAKFGNLYPYKSHYSKDVENTIFMLMLAPWEDWLSEYDLNWRPFDIPWVHTIHSDIFERQCSIPDASTLSWCPDHRMDNAGELVVLESPCERICFVKDSDITPFVNEVMRSNLKTAINNGLINIAAQHQLLKAFISYDVDEFLAHIVVIDACVGATYIENNKITEKYKRFKKINSTNRLIYRLTGLLEDKSVEADMKRLYEYRSRLVHGNDIKEIDSEARIQARRLTRRMLFAIIQLAAQNPTLTREKFLYDTLHKGLVLIEGK